MRILILFLFFVHGCSCYAFENCFAVGKDGAKTTYSTCAACEQAEGQQCFSITGQDPEILKVVDVTEDDLEEPVYKAAYNVVSCAGKSEQECAQMVEHEEFCIEGDQGYYRVVDGVLEGYCTKLLGYEQKVVGKTVEVDQEKKSAKEQVQSQKAQIDALISEGLKRQEVGKRIIALIAANNDAKELTTEQTVTLTSTLEPIIRLLQVGSIDAAKSKVQELQPDGELILQADIDLGLSAFEAEGY